MRRAAVSIEANIVEGYALQTPAQFRRHLRIALGSAAETECMLELVASGSYLPGHISDELLNLNARLLGLIFGLIRKLSG